MLFDFFNSLRIEVDITITLYNKRNRLPVKEILMISSSSRQKKNEMVVNRNNT